jgi:hypothetical protein
VAKVGELDRANLKEGQQVVIRLDAVGGKMFRGQIKSMSGTASANIFSGDPAKKFDVIFAIDMKELLTGLGARPEQIAKIMAQAEANRKKPPMQGLASGGPMMMGGGAGMMGGGMAGGAGGQGGGAVMMARAGGDTGAGEQGGSGAGAGGGGRRGMFLGGPGGPGGSASSLSEEDRKKMREAMQKALNGKQMQDLTSEERQKVFEEVRKAVPALAAAQRSGQAGQSGARGEGQAGGRAQGQEGGRAGRGMGGDAMPMMAMGGATGRFSEADLQNAKLPPPVDPENQLEVLLRPGLLADVEIILEKITNALHIPSQAVFEKDGKMIVYVRNENRWDERVVKPLKRSESVMVLAGGVQPGETIALADPYEKPGAKKSDKPAGGAVGSLPGGGRT